MTRLTEHFTLEELIRSDIALKLGVENKPNNSQYKNLINLAVFLEQVRKLIGKPIIISSGFRCLEVNAAVGGRPNSDHLYGRAADTKVQSLTIKQYFKLLADSDLQYDKIIIEFNRWVHISIPPEDKPARRMKLIIDQHGERVYEET